MALKDFITAAVSVTALLLSLASFFRSRRIDRVANRQSFIDKKYAALAKEEEQQNQMFGLLIRLLAIQHESAELNALRNTLNDLLQRSRERSQRLSELEIDHPDEEVDLILRERLGLLSERTALLASLEAKVGALEALHRP
jgi:hypothetical protein